MATPAQILANKQNAQKSTGPRTEAGKAASSKNRLSHGFNSSEITIAGEDPQKFQALLDGLLAEYQPATDTEQMLVEKMAVHQWISLRATRLQGRVFLNNALKEDNSPIPRNLGLLIRYHTSAERAFLRMHTELVKAQKERRKSEIGFEPKKTAAPHPKPDPIAFETAHDDLPASDPLEKASPDTPFFLQKVA